MDRPRTRTPRRAAEGSAPYDRLWTTLLEDAADGLLLIGPDRRVRALNPAAARLVGVRVDAARGRDAGALLRTVVPGDDVVDEAFRAETTERETVLASPAGETPVLLRARRLGRPPWVLLSLHDHSQQRRMHEELRRHERLATLGQLSAGVAHEIRNPLAGIGTSAQVLLRRFEPRDERARFVRVILDEVSRLDRIVTSLLQYARPRTPQLAPVALAECVARVAELSAGEMAAASVVVETEVAPRLPAVWVDADLIQQVLLNVTRNGIQAMAGGGTLRYAVRTVRRRRASRGVGRRAGDRARGGRDPGWVRFQQVRVSDTGTGIPRGQLAKLFDPFFSTKPQGTGLGLSISQTIMQEHGGTIEVASREGRGTTVLLNFPVEKRHGERRGADQRSRRAHAADR